MLADVLTMQENFDYDLKGRNRRVHGRRRATTWRRSLMVVCAKLGMNFVACGPKELHARPPTLVETVPRHRRRERLPPSS